MCSPLRAPWGSVKSTTFVFVKPIPSSSDLSLDSDLHPFPKSHTSRPYFPLVPSINTYWDPPAAVVLTSVHREDLSDSGCSRICILKGQQGRKQLITQRPAFHNGLGPKEFPRTVWTRITEEASKNASLWALPTNWIWGWGYTKAPVSISTFVILVPFELHHHGHRGKEEGRVWGPDTFWQLSTAFVPLFYTHTGRPTLLFLTIAAEETLKFGSWKLPRTPNREGRWDTKGRETSIAL